MWWAPRYFQDRGSPSLSTTTSSQVVTSPCAERQNPDSSSAIQPGDPEINNRVLFLLKSLTISPGIWLPFCSDFFCLFKTPERATCSDSSVWPWVRRLSDCFLLVTCLKLWKDTGPQLENPLGTLQVGYLCPAPQTSMQKSAQLPYLHQMKVPPSTSFYFLAVTKKVMELHQRLNESKNVFLFFCINRLIQNVTHFSLYILLKEVRQSEFSVMISFLCHCLCCHSSMP